MLPNDISVFERHAATVPFIDSDQVNNISTSRILSMVTVGVMCLFYC